MVCYFKLSQLLDDSYTEVDVIESTSIEVCCPVFVTLMVNSDAQ